MQLDRVAAKIVLENLRRNLRTRAFLRQELLSLGPAATLQEFLSAASVELEDLYRGRTPGWVWLRREVGYASGGGDEPLLRAAASLTYMDSLEQIRAYQEFLTGAPLGAPYSQMLRFSLWSGAEAAAASLEQVPREELAALLPVLERRIDHLSHPLEEHPDVPLRVHCHYSLDESLAAFGVLTAERPYRIREGVHHTSRAAATCSSSPSASPNATTAPPPSTATMPCPRNSFTGTPRARPGKTPLTAGAIAGTT